MQHIRLGALPASNADMMMHWHLWKKKDLWSLHVLGPFQDLQVSLIPMLNSRKSLSLEKHTLRAMVIWQSLLGQGWKDDFLRMLWLEGRMRTVTDLLTHSPSTLPIFTSEFAMADLLTFN